MAITKNGALPAAAGVGDVTLTGTQTLTNKTLTSPVVSGLTLSDGSLVLEGATANDFETTIQVTDPTADRTITIPDATTTLVGTDTTDTLTNKTLTAPKFADSGFIADANGNELIAFPSTVASAVNQVLIENAATGDGVTTGQPIIRAQGNDTNISLNLVPKGSGVVQANGVAVVTTSGTQTLTNKTLSSATLTGTLTAGGGTGSSGQVLVSTGSGVQWGAAAETLSPFNHAFLTMGA